MQDEIIWLVKKESRLFCCSLYGNVIEQVFLPSAEGKWKRFSRQKTNQKLKNENEMGWQSLEIIAEHTANKKHIKKSLYRKYQWKLEELEYTK